MLSVADYSEWGAGLDTEGGRIFKALDLDTINRSAASCADLAQALQITASWLVSGNHCVSATKRNQNNDAWLVLCR